LEGILQNFAEIPLEEKAIPVLEAGNSRFGGASPKTG